MKKHYLQVVFTNTNKRIAITKQDITHRTITHLGKIRVRLSLRTIFNDSFSLTY